jgi:hypothetical protein
MDWFGLLWCLLWPSRQTWVPRFKCVFENDSKILNENNQPNIQSWRKGSDKIQPIVKIIILKPHACLKSQCIYLKTFSKTLKDLYIFIIKPSK